MDPGCCMAAPDQNTETWTGTCEAYWNEQDCLTPIGPQGYVIWMHLRGSSTVSSTQYGVMLVIQILSVRVEPDCIERRLQPGKVRKVLHKSSSLSMVHWFCGLVMANSIANGR